MPLFILITLIIFALAGSTMLWQVETIIPGLLSLVVLVFLGSWLFIWASSEPKYVSETAKEYEVMVFDGVAYIKSDDYGFVDMSFKLRRNITAGQTIVEIIKVQTDYQCGIWASGYEDVEYVVK